MHVHTGLRGCITENPVGQPVHRYRFRNIFSVNAIGVYVFSINITFNSQRVGGKTISVLCPEVILFSVDGLPSVLNGTGIVHIVFISINGLPSGPDPAVVPGIIKISVQLEEPESHCIGIVSVFCGSPEVILAAADGLPAFLDGAGAVHMVFKAVDDLPSGPDHAVCACVIGLSVDLEEFRGKCIGIMAVSGRSPEIVLFTVNGLPAFLNGAAAGHVIFKTIDGLPSGPDHAVCTCVISPAVDIEEFRGKCIGIMTIARAGPEIVFFAVDVLDPFLNGAGAVHMVFKAVDGLPSGPDHAVVPAVIGLAADTEEFRGKCIGIVALSRGCPEIVLFAADGLPSVPDHTVSAHVIFITVDGLPSGRHDAAFAEIVFFLADRGKTCFSACFGVYIVDFAFHGDPAGLFTAFRVIEPFAGCIFPAGKSGRFRSHRFHRGQR